MEHELKILPAFFEAVLCGDKRFEIRQNGDRGFQRGHRVALKEHSPGKGLLDHHCFTGREIKAIITYVSDYDQPANQVVFGFKVGADCGS